jgi:hypothetical protein
MHVGVILNDRSFREAVVKTLQSSGEHTVKDYATAAAALVDLTAKPFDLIAVDAVTFPGFGAGDSHINDLAALIPKTDYNETVFELKEARMSKHQLLCACRMPCLRRWVWGMCLVKRRCGKT